MTRKGSENFEEKVIICCVELQLLTKKQKKKRSKPFKTSAWKVIKIDKSNNEWESERVTESLSLKKKKEL